MYLRACSKHPLFRRRSERVLIDVYEVCAGIENGGVESFLSAYIKHRRVIRSFRRIGEHKVADILQECLENKKINDVDSVNSELWCEIEKVSQKLSNTC